RLALLAQVWDQRGDQARLADAGRPGDADRVRAPRLRIELANELCRERVGVLDERDRPRERPAVAGPDAVDETLARPGAPVSQARTSEPAPSPTTSPSRRSSRPPASSSRCRPP